MPLNVDADLMPLAELIATQRAAIARLSAAAALWQERARVLEGRLRMLQAGPIPGPPPASATPPRRRSWRRRLIG